MNLKVYEKTRYQNIYRHKKNRNYLISISEPVKSSISSINGEKIWKIEDAVKIRDNPKIKLQKKADIECKGNFDDLFNKYLENCIYTEKLSYSSIRKKKLLFNKYLKEKINKPLSKLNKEFLSRFLDNIDTTNKQKNEILKHLKVFFYWCIKEEYLIINPIKDIAKYKTVKEEMKYWTKEEITKFFKYMDSVEETEVSLRIKTLVILGFTLGDRIGETRALTFGNIHKNTILINHSINYDRKSKDFLGNTKNYHSQRLVDVSEKVTEAVMYFKKYLINLGYNITDDTLIFLNHKTNKPLDDVLLRKQFYHYCNKANVTKIRLYDLRHTYATTMMAEGKEPYTFSKRMGHKSIKTTIDVYGHISEKTRKELAKSTDKYF